MSIVALKRKTAASRGISGGSQGFSINGTTRLQGSVGQGNIARHLVHTPFGGSVPRDQNGHGIEHIVEPSELCNLNDKNVVKTSVLSGAAAIRNRVDKTQINVKPGIDSMLLSQSLYLDRLKRKNLKKIAAECPEPDPADIPLPPVCPVDKELFTRTYRRAAACRYPITKTVEQEDQQSRLDRLAEACSAYDPKQPVVAIRRAPVVNR
jgi:hypothetical protein